MKETIALRLTIWGTCAALGVAIMVMIGVVIGMRELAEWLAR